MKSDNNNNDLRKIRKDKGLSVIDVAGQLKLTQCTIKKLEESKFKELGAYTYVRGYIINYANLLGVDSDKYLALIPATEFEVPLVNTSSNLAKGIKLRRQSRSMVNYLIGTFVVLIVSVSGWYQLKKYTTVSKAVEPEIKISQSNNNSNSSLLNATSVVNEEGNDKDDENFHYSSLIPQNSENKTPDTDNIELPTEDEAQMQNANQDTDEPVVQINYEISIEALETSWVKVEYLNGVKLHNDLLQPGMIQLSSNEPVHFRIGNGSQVKVTINGKAIDLSQFSRKNIADFNWPIDN
jgi:cytoskeleton protein RodZ